MYEGFIDLDAIGYRPVSLIELDFSGQTFRFSTRETVTANGFTYVPERVRFSRKTSSQDSATRINVAIENLDGRFTAQAVSGEWQGNSVRVYDAALYAENSESMVSDFVNGVYISGNPSDTFALVELSFEGELVGAPRIGEWVEFEAIRKGARTSFTPRHRSDANMGWDWTPPQGRVVEIDGELYELRGRDSL